MSLLCIHYILIIFCLKCLWCELIVTYNGNRNCFLDWSVLCKYILHVLYNNGVAFPTQSSQIACGGETQVGEVTHHLQYVVTNCNAGCAPDVLVHDICLFMLMARETFIHALANQLMSHCRASSVDAVSAALSAKRISLINTLQVTGN